MIGLIQALLNFAAALDNRTVRSPDDSELDQYIPSNDDLTRLFDNNRGTLESNLAAYLDIVRERWNRAESEGIREILNQSRSIQSQMSGQDVKWIDGRYGLRGSKISMFYHRVSSEQESVALAISLVTEADPTVAIQNMTADKPLLLESVAELRRLDDLLIRILSAKKAATLTGCTLAETLALYRTEGNLGVPRSAESIDLLIPPREPGYTEGSSFSYYEKTNSPNLSSLVYLWEADHFTSEDEAKNEALIAWLVHVAGLDYYASLGPEIARISSVLWSTQMGSPVSEASRQTAFDQLKANLRIETVLRNASGDFEITSGLISGEMVRVLPLDNELLISSILAEATLLLRYVGRPRHLNNSLDDPSGFVPGNWIAPPRLTYALYNLQVGTPAGSPMQAFVMSALVHGYRTKGAKYQELRDEIDADSTLKAKMKASIISAVTKNDVITSAIVSANFPPIKAWLMHTTKGKKRIELLSHFIETADRRVWTSWDKAGINSYRGNANRYHMLYVYFHLLTSESLPF